MLVDSRMYELEGGLGNLKMNSLHSFFKKHIKVGSGGHEHFPDKLAWVLCVRETSQSDRVGTRTNGLSAVRRSSYLAIFLSLRNRLTMFEYK